MVLDSTRHDFLKKKKKKKQQYAKHYAIYDCDIYKRRILEIGNENSPCFAQCDDASDLNL